MLQVIFDLGFQHSFNCILLLLLFIWKNQQCENQQALVNLECECEHWTKISNWKKTDRHLFFFAFPKQVVQKTASTFAPRASSATKNPAVPGSALYIVFEVQGYVSMLLGGALSFNLLFPSNEPDIWRLMGMWSIWMFSKFLPTNFNLSRKVRRKNKHLVLLAWPLCT